MKVPDSVVSIHEDGRVQKDIDDRRKDNNDTFVLVTGPTGEGKSTLGLQLGFKHRAFSLDNVSWVFRQINRNTRLISQGGVHVIDEPNELHNMNFRTKDGVTLENLFINSRYKEHLTILCGPYIAKLLKVVLLRSHYWLHVPYRGVVFVFKANPWSMGVNKYGIDLRDLDKVVSEDTFIKHVLAPAQAVGAFEGAFSFPQFTAEFNKKVFAKYLGIKNEFFMSGGDGNNGKDKDRLALGELVYTLHESDPSRFSYSKVAAMIKLVGGYSKPSLSRLVKDFKTHRFETDY